MYRIMILLVFALPASKFPSAFAQSLRSRMTAAYTAVNGYSERHFEASSIIGNPASLALADETSVVLYGERKYGLQELGFYQLAAAFPLRAGNFGLAGCYSGFEAFSETQLGLTHARNLGEKVELGVQFNYYNARAAGYGSASAIHFSVAAILHPGEKIQVGLSAHNPVGGKLEKAGSEKLSSVFGLGLTYDASEKFFTSFLVEKEEGQGVNVLAGFHYKIIRQILLCGGVSANASIMFFGAGVYLGRSRIDAVINYHPDLGISPGLLLMLELEKKK